MVTAEQLAEARRALGRQLADRREAAGLTQAQLARLTGYTRSAIANVETGRGTQPRSSWRRYDELLRADGVLLAGYDHYAALAQRHRRQAAEERERQRAVKLEQYAHAIAADTDGGYQAGRARTEGDAETVDHVHELVWWLAQRSDRQVGPILAEVALHVAELRRAESHRRLHGRPGLSRPRAAEQVLRYYGPWEGSPLEPYRFACGDEQLTLSVVVRPEWTGLHVPLSSSAEQVDLTAGASAGPPFDDLLVSAATRRIGTIVAAGTRIVDTAIYRLVNVRTTPGTLHLTFDITTFVEYALTMDLLESELVTAGDGAIGLPVRDRLLPDLAAVADVGSRTCVGGVVALFAVAREADHRRPRPDIALVVQQRSDRVLNAVGRLATIPKAFHEPLTDLRHDARPSATLFREMEEELFGRVEVDSTEPQAYRLADPMHPRQLSEPMQWLSERRSNGAWRAECVGVGLNLVSGNYEFACLILIEDPQWWSLFGGMVEGNWETNELQVYSYDDADLLRTLMVDPAWSNEGLFAFAEGLRRLQEITGSSSVEVVHG